MVSLHHCRRGIILKMFLIKQLQAQASKGCTSGGPALSSWPQRCFCLEQWAASGTSQGHSAPVIWAADVHPVSGILDKAASDKALGSSALSSFEQKCLGGLSAKSNWTLLGAAATAVLKLVPSHPFLWSSTQRQSECSGLVVQVAYLCTMQTTCTCW